jgi:MMP 1-O-methyltransferase
MVELPRQPSRKIGDMNYQEVLQHTNKITSGVTDAEASLLYHLAEEAHLSSVGTVVEIGAYTGKSTIILAATGLVYSIDHHRGNTEHQLGQPRCRPGTVIDGHVDTYPLFKSNVQATGLWHNVVPIITDHLTALSHLNSQVFPVSLLFVDAEHSYETTISIIELWIPHVQGIVVFHDYCDDFPEVIRAVNDAQLGVPTHHIDSLVGFTITPTPEPSRYSRSRLTQEAGEN